MQSLKRAYAGKRVFVTGHTGFKGSWLCEWLLSLGAEVWGYSLPPPTKPALFDQLRLSRRIERHQIGDIRDAKALAQAMRRSRPHYVFHLAAQPIVRASYAQPTATWETNVLGTINVLEALRRLPKPCAAVIVTTDKVYANVLPRPHPETDPLGGNDPYSASKAAAEIAVASWRASYFSAAGTSAIATARAGNVIGGGDWAADRLLPDCARALRSGRAIEIRNPASIRPWQHVLDPLHGYLLLAAKLKTALDSKRTSLRSELRGAFNFGPVARDHRTVRKVVAEVLKHWSGKWGQAREPNAPHEAAILRLDIAKAHRVLGWRPGWNFRKAIEQTIVWYRDSTAGSAIELTAGQIADFARK